MRLGWRLAAIVKGGAPISALAAYDRERCHGADENLLNSSPAPPGSCRRRMALERLFRDAVLHLAGARRFRPADGELRPVVAALRLSAGLRPMMPSLPDGARPGCGGARCARWAMAG